MAAVVLARNHKRAKWHVLIPGQNLEGRVVGTICGSSLLGVDRQLTDQPVSLNNLCQRCLYSYALAQLNKAVYEATERR